MKNPWTILLALVLIALFLPVTATYASNQSTSKNNPDAYRCPPDCPTCYEYFYFYVFPNATLADIQVNGGSSYQNGNSLQEICQTSIGVQPRINSNVPTGYVFFLWDVNGNLYKTSSSTVSGCSTNGCSVDIDLYLETEADNATGWCCAAGGTPNPLQWNYPNREIDEVDPYQLLGTSGETGYVYMDDFQNENLNNYAWNITSTLGNVPKSGIIGYGDVFYGIGHYTSKGQQYWKNTSVVSTMSLPMTYSTLTSDNLYIYSEYHVNNNDGGNSEFSVTTDNTLVPQGDYDTGNYPSVEIMVMPFVQNYPSSSDYSINIGNTFVNGQEQSIGGVIFNYWCNSDGVTGQDGVQISFANGGWNGGTIGFNFSLIAADSVTFVSYYCGTNFPSLWLPSLVWGVEYGATNGNSIFNVVVNNYYTTSYSGTTEYL
jgi:hypothetical protein